MPRKKSKATPRSLAILVAKIMAVFLAIYIVIALVNFAFELLNRSSDAAVFAGSLILFVIVAGFVVLIVYAIKKIQKLSMAKKQ